MFCLVPPMEMPWGWRLGHWRASTPQEEEKKGGVLPWWCSMIAPHPPLFLVRRWFHHTVRRTVIEYNYTKTPPGKYRKHFCLGLSLLPAYTIVPSQGLIWISPRGSIKSPFYLDPTSVRKSLISFLESIMGGYRHFDTIFPHNTVNIQHSDHNSKV